jgi:TolB-like protein
VAAARRAAHLDPDDESAARRLIELHRRFGDNAGALRAYDELARRLATEFGARPSVETVSLILPLRTPLESPLAPAPVAPADFPTAVPTAPSSPRRADLTLRWAAAAGLSAAVLGGGVYQVTRPAPTTRADAAMVAVVPFRTSGAAPELDWLSEGMVDLLTLKLDGRPGPQAVDARSVLNVWRGARPATAALEVARRAGAGRAIQGSVVGTPSHLTITASLVGGPPASSMPRVAVEGPLDSLIPLVDQLAARLLTQDAGTEARRVSALGARSLPAVRAYLAGRASFRKGLLRESLDHFRESTSLDSTFALAWLELLHLSRWVDRSAEEAERGRRLAWAAVNQLGPADRALLDAWSHPFQTRPELFQRWQAAARAYPAEPEVWYGLGDAYYHYGMLGGLAAPFTQASDAFRRGWALDFANGAGPVNSPGIFAEPLTHMVEQAQVDGDTAAVLRLAALGLAADSASAKGWYLRWHCAVVAGRAALEQFWADSAAFDPEVFALIHRFTASSGVASGEYGRSAAPMLRSWQVTDPGGAAFERRVLALNGGRPTEAARALAGDLDAPLVSLGLPIREALYWGGDTALAVEAAWRLTSYAGGGPAVGTAGQLRMQALCTLATWRQAHGDQRYAENAIRSLRRMVVRKLAPDDSLAVAQYASLCAALLEAARAEALHLPEARAALERADTAARSLEVGQSLGANLVIARLAEEEGNPDFALRAIRRRASGYDLLPAWYLSTFLLEEGRLAALTGDIAGAVRADRHYLSLRPDPEPRVMPEVDRVRAHLATLLSRGRTRARD